MDMDNPSIAEFLYNPAILKEIKLSDLPNVVFNPPLTLDQLGDALRIRPLKISDYSAGFPHVLSQLTAVGDVSEEQFISTFKTMKNTPNTYYVTVIEDKATGQVIGSATLVIEQKFIHDCAKRARIEDVVVSDAYRGKQLGKVLISTMTVLAKHLSCYKISLDCRDAMLTFYQGLGFKKEEGNSNFMVIRY